MKHSYAPCNNRCFTALKSALQNPQRQHLDNVFILSYSGLRKEVANMSQVLINIRIDEDLKKAMENTCQMLGMNITTAFTIFAKKMTREKRIPFEVSVDPFYSDRNIAAINEAVLQIERGQVVVKTLEELELMENG
jgi:DNA-damage-inducible protein J